MPLEYYVYFFQLLENYTVFQVHAIVFASFVACSKINRLNFAVPSVGDAGTSGFCSRFGHTGGKLIFAFFS